MDCGGTKKKKGAPLSRRPLFEELQGNRSVFRIEDVVYPR